MPAKSYFRFGPPTNARRWRLAQSQAASGEQVLLREVRKAFPHHLDFLDGDILFKKYHELSNIFLDHNTDLSELTTQDTTKRGMGAARKKTKSYVWDNWGHADLIPRGYDFRPAKRAPIVQVGYNAFSRVNRSHFFEGPHLGEAHVQIPHLIGRWKEIKDMIDTPFILLHAGNENWGLLSTEFPNRTINWGSCCGNYPEVQQILDHDKTILVLTNQHHNLTHPKLLSLPRGMPVHQIHRKLYLWDTMRVYEQSLRKNSLIFASNSNWKHRPYVSKCIASKFAAEKSMETKEYDVEKGKGGRMTEKEYYRRIAASRTSVTLAGLGYDSFRYIDLVAVFFVLNCHYIALIQLRNENLIL